MTSAADDAVLAPPLRRALRRVAGTVFLIAAGREGRRCGLTATSVTSLSLEPPALLACIDRRSATYARLLEERRFSVNLLSVEHESCARVFSSPCVSGEMRFAQSQWREWGQSVPLLAGASASVVCEVDRTIPFGSHGLVIGRVIHVQLGSNTAATPLLYLDGSYRSVSPGGSEQGFARKVAPDVLREQ